MQNQELTHSGSLTLADGSSWAIAAEDSCGENIGRSLSDSMQLKPVSHTEQTLMILKNGLKSKNSIQDFISAKNLQSLAHDNRITCQLYPALNNDILAVQLMKLSLLFCSQAEARGGLLVHGGLAEKDGQGVILAGPGDAGKTTASRRLPLPWKSLSDDCTLIVRDKDGVYHAHPWPTWSQFMFGGPGGSWNVQRSVPLKAIFLLAQSKKDQVVPLGQGKAACLLNETTEQAWLGFSFDLESRMKRSLSLQRFENTCSLVKAIPSYLLHISRNGSFWEEIEKVLPGK